MSSASSPSHAPGVQVRHCHALAEFEACIALEREVWGSTESDVVPAPIFVVAAHTGGQVLGAFDRAPEQERLVGFTLALAGYREGPFLHSHMTAVLPEYRDRGVGRQLKLFQREDALSRGIERIEWTFDPLEPKNAHFNLERLGAIARQYLLNVYGITTSPLHAGLPTDRLLAEWWLKSPRAVRCSAGEAPQRTSQPVRIGVPLKISDWKREKPDAAARVQAELREQFLEWFGRGYAVTGFARAGENGEYLLEPLADPRGAE